MRYNIVYKTYNRNRFNSDEDSGVTISDVQEFSEMSEKTFLDVINDIIDPPSRELTLSEVEEDFSCFNYKIDLQTAEAILKYYNNRYALHCNVLKWLESAKSAILNGDDDKSVFTYTFSDSDYEFPSSAKNQSTIESYENSIVLTISKE